MATIKDQYGHSLKGLELAMARGEKGLPDDKWARARQIWAQWDQFPGRAPGGTGLTGLNPNDAKGYSEMLNEQTEGMNLENEMNGRAPVTIRRGFDFPAQADIPSQPYDPTYDTAALAGNGPYGAFGTQAQTLAGLSAQQRKPLPETHEAFMARMAKQYGKR